MSSYIPIPVGVKAQMCIEMVDAEALPPIPISNPAYQRMVECLIHDQHQCRDDAGGSNEIKTTLELWQIKFNPDTMKEEWMEVTSPP